MRCRSQFIYMGISECRWLGAGRIQLSSGKTGQTKGNMEEDGRERKGTSWMEKLE